MTRKRMSAECGKCGSDIHISEMDFSGFTGMLDIELDPREERRAFKTGDNAVRWRCPRCHSEHEGTQLIDEGMSEQDLFHDETLEQWLEHEDYAS